MRFHEEVIGIAGLVLLATVLGLFTQAWGWSFVVAFLLYVLRNMYFFAQFLRMVKSPDLVAQQVPFGVWGDVFDAYFEKSYKEKRQIKRLRSETDQVQQAMNLLPDAHISLSKNFKIEWINHAAEDLLGLNQRDVGQLITNLLRQPEIIAYFEMADFEQSVEFYQTHQSTQRLSASMVPYFQHHFLFIVRDITAEHNLAQVRRDFVANASHELRTPLTVVTGYLELMQDELASFPPLWHGPVEQMSSQAQRMQNIINDLLTLSSIEADSYKTPPDVIDMQDVLMALEQEMHQLSQNEHDIKFEIATHKNLFGLVDPLRSVFVNLVSNAIRYTPAGGKITVRWFENKQHQLVFQVKDTGIGIAREDIPRLTERFYRVDTARSRSSGGTGLGLAIVKHIIERHQAKLDIQSRLKVGSTFRVIFPTAMVRDPA
ncbi:phosphate regulon sensor histidine kinase PhoR [Thiomicrospira sp. ALE5]|uniref:phosphate regulon sensor histidine kinase PhoR n=1 Tax=Thiomicrospira sp. ALE5 TaxID=748650 RepID=UPI0008F40EF8|nr:phosphate regulon sensor histidine kinase PhoR [Thiomicrospira sp. ALE5]SFR53753.1 two-component system, OmpR family, phosphate regulon sensor histidine kinase PhoR [Thiomicrospira sp. ALE5]